MNPQPDDLPEDGYSKRLVDEMFRARDLAVNVALNSMEKRLDAMNEFRATLKDQAGTFMPRAEFMASHASLASGLDDLRLRVVASSSKSAEADKAVAATAASIDKRLEMMNEFRAQIKDQTTTFLTRSEYIAAHNELVRINDQLRLDVNRYSALLDELARTVATDAANLDKKIDIGAITRETLRDQALTFARKADTDGMLSHLVDDYKRNESAIAAINSRLDRAEGMMGASSTRTTTLVSIVLAVVAILGVGLTYFNSLAMQKSFQAHVDTEAQTPARQQQPAYQPPAKR